MIQVIESNSLDANIGLAVALIPVILIFLYMATCYDNPYDSNQSKEKPEKKIITTDELLNNYQKNQEIYEKSNYQKIEKEKYHAQVIKQTHDINFNRTRPRKYIKKER